MRCFLGVDGGATKTMTALGDETGRILGTGAAGPSNYQAVGIEQAMRNVRQSVEAALMDASVTIGRVAYGLFALAGADYATDFEALARGLWRKTTVSCSSRGRAQTSRQRIAPARR